MKKGKTLFRLKILRIEGEIVTIELTRLKDDENTSQRINMMEEDILDLKGV
jgi:hypothetical protein